MWPGAPLVVEVHRRPSQPFWLAPVSAESLFRTAVPSAVDVPGILAPEPAAHAVLVVAHAWNHDPLGSVGQLLDAAALLAAADRRRAGAFARAWGWEGMWNTTLAVMDAVLGGDAPELRPQALGAPPSRRARAGGPRETHESGGGARLEPPAWRGATGDGLHAPPHGRTRIGRELDDAASPLMPRDRPRVPAWIGARAKPRLDRTTNKAPSPALDEGASPRGPRHHVGRRSDRLLGRQHQASTHPGVGHPARYPRRSRGGSTLEAEIWLILPNSEQIPPSKLRSFGAIR